MRRREPDPRELGPGARAPWVGFEKLVLASAGIRERLETVTGRRARFTWFLRMDPQVAEVWGSPTWAAETYERQFQELTGTGDEIGVHPHSWRWNASAGRWVSDQADRDWVTHCARVSLEAYEEAFGHPCAAYRHGDHAMTTDLLRFLDTTALHVDLTVEPGLPGTFGLAPEELTTGWIEDTRSVPTSPYRPSRDDFRVPDPDRNDGLLIIPLTRALDIDLVADGGRLSPRGRWGTLFLWDDPDRFRTRLARCVADPTLTHLAFGIRSELAIRDPWAWFEANLAELGRHPVARRLGWCTASEAAEALGPTPFDPRARSRPDVPDPRRAGLWAAGGEDPGFLDGAEADALDLLRRAGAEHLQTAHDLATRLEAALAERAELADLPARLAAEEERARQLTTHLEAAESDLAEARAHATHLEARVAAEIEAATGLAHTLEATSAQLQAMRETSTWRAHDRLSPLLRALRRVMLHR